MSPPSTPRPIEILLVEDNPGDVRLTQEAFKDSKVTNRLHVVTDGVEAMQFLRREAKHADAPRPDLILLDLNLPKKDGREVLAEIREDPEVHMIPVVVLTASKVDEDICRAYELQCSCYITKPVDFEQFTHVVKSIQSFWLTIVTLPSEP
jgi:chemotaxis family two-component system response regulator Rcp1